MTDEMGSRGVAARLRPSYNYIMNTGRFNYHNYNLHSYLSTNVDNKYLSFDNAKYCYDHLSF